MKRSCVVLAAGIALTGAAACSDGSSSAEVDSNLGVWAQAGSESWRLEHDLTVGVLEGDAAHMFGSIRDVVPGPDNSLWILDGQALELRQFDASGEHLRTVGGLGDGPGEFSGNTCAFAGPEEEVWVESSGRWHRFSATGDLISTFPSPRASSCMPVAWTPSGEMVGTDARLNRETMSPEARYIVPLVDASSRSEPADSFRAPILPAAPRLEWKDSEDRTVIFQGIPLTHQQFIVLGPNADLWISEGTGDYRILRQTLAGDTVAILERDVERVTVPDDVRAAAISALDHSMFGMPVDFEASAVPNAFPPFEMVHVSKDGSAWVLRRVGDREHVFDVFDTDGEFLGSVEVPFNLDTSTVHSVTRDHVILKTWDELEVERAVRFRVIRPAQ